MEKLNELKTWLEIVKASHQNAIAAIEKQLADAQAAQAGIPQERDYIVMLDATLGKVNEMIAQG